MSSDVRGLRREPTRRDLAERCDCRTEKEERRSVNDLLSNVLLFGRLLRRAGLDVHHGRMLDAAQALTSIDVGRKGDVRTALRSLLVHRHEDLAPIRRGVRPVLSFAIGHIARPAAVLARRASARGGTSVGGHAGQARRRRAERQPVVDARCVVGAYSAAEVSRTKDFSEFTDAELARAQAMLASLPWHLGVRRTRRWEAARGSALDLRRLARRNLMRGGELLELPRRRRREAPRPLVLLADVSGSMERYSRVLLHFAYGLAHGARHVESFVFATRLTRVTRSLATRGSRQGPVATGRASAGLGWRHADRRGAARLQHALGAPCHAQRPGGADRLGWLGSRRSR